MHILYIHQYFKTPDESGGTRSYFIAKKMIERGHKVSMICSTCNKEKVGRNEVEGISVHYLYAPYKNEMGKLGRIKAFLSFMYKAIRLGKSIKDVDLMYATSTPLTVGYIAHRIKKATQTPYIFEVRDLWPEFPIQMGAIKNKQVIAFLKKWEKTFYDEASAIIALSPGMEEGVLACGINKKKVTMIPNMSKPDIFYPHEADKELMKKFSLNEEHFKIVYFGAMGLANGIDYIIDAAKILKEEGHDKFDFIFVGGGSTASKAEEKAKQLGLANVSFLSRQSMLITAEIVNCCQCSIVTFLDRPILHTNSPNKLFDSLSAGKPIIVNSRGWTKDLVEQHRCGLFVDPDDAANLAKGIIALASDKDTLTEYSKNSRKISLEIYDKEKLCTNVVDVVESTLL